MAVVSGVGTAGAGSAAATSTPRARVPTVAGGAVALPIMTKASTATSERPTSASLTPSSPSTPSGLTRRVGAGAAAEREVGAAEASWTKRALETCFVRTLAPWRSTQASLLILSAGGRWVPPCTGAVGSGGRGSRRILVWSAAAAAAHDATYIALCAFHSLDGFASVHDMFGLLGSSVYVHMGMAVRGGTQH